MSIQEHVSRYKILQYMITLLHFNYIDSAFNELLWEGMFKQRNIKQIGQTQIFLLFC